MIRTALRYFMWQGVLVSIAASRKAAFALAFTVVIHIALTTASAQFPMSEGRSPASTERELEEHVARMRYLISQANKRRPGRNRDPKLALEQLQEDFVRVQIVNRDLVLTTSDQAKLDLKLVARSAREINKRAKRLLENLALPESAIQADTTSVRAIEDDARLRTAITQMGWKIYYFAKNEIFKEANVIDTAAAEKARNDLEQIIDLSALIETGSERLGKARKQN